MSATDRIYDVLIIGGGHAGVEAFCAACRLGARVGLVTPDLEGVACQPCNPAVGGPGKGHLVREVVALGGLIGRVTDQTGIQFRTLNKRKGPAVRATRVQTDSGLYMTQMAAALTRVRGELIEDRAIALGWDTAGGKKQIRGVQLERRGPVEARTVVVATGTFLCGQLFIGDRTEPGGRRGALPAVRLARSLAETGLPLMRLKTGTCPRLAGPTVDPSGLEEQRGDIPPPFFDPSTAELNLAQRICHVTYTGPRAHEVISNNLTRSALYSGGITGVGPRYCPSIETKIARFPEKERHQIFLEPEDVDGTVIYPSGLSTSLPEEVQEEMVHAIPGLEQAVIVRHGYAVEYDAVQPHALFPSLEVDGLSGLFLAGQILGTSGYEEAAALGLLAGANAALKIRGDEPLVLGRGQAYAGVMVDDLTSRGVDEPYRMFTSRAEYRLLLREDNADERLVQAGVRTGLVGADRARIVEQRRASADQAAEQLAATVITPSVATKACLRDAGLPQVAKPTSLFDLLRRPGVCLRDLRPLAPWLGELADAVQDRLEVRVKYSGYLERQQAQAERLRHVDEIPLPADLELDQIPGLRAEIAEKIRRARPATLGQVSRLPGVTPAALQILHVWCAKHTRSSGGPSNVEG